MVFTKSTEICHQQIFVKMFLSLELHVNAYLAVEQCI